MRKKQIFYYKINYCFEMHLNIYLYRNVCLKNAVKNSRFSKNNNEIIMGTITCCVSLEWLCDERALEG